MAPTPRHLGAAVAALLALALTLLSLSGWMPGETADGGFGLIPCPGAGPGASHAQTGHGAHATPSMVMHAGHGATRDPTPPYSPSRRDGGCPWAALAVPVLLDPPTLVPAAVARPAPPPSPAAATPLASGRGLAAPPPPARAPPLNV